MKTVYIPKGTAVHGDIGKYVYLTKKGTVTKSKMKNCMKFGVIIRTVPFQGWDVEIDEE